ncbi:MAG: ABC transporter permease [Lysobacterales bacterium]
MNLLLSAIQRLRRSPGYTLGLLATMTLGLCLTITMFAIVHGVAFAPLPYPGGDRVVVVNSQRIQSGARGGITPQNAVDTLSDLDELEAFAYYTYGGADLKVDGRPSVLTINQVSSGFFDVFAMPAMLGRTLRAGDGGQARAVLSHQTWQQLGADPDIVGKTLTLNWISPEIVGVMAPEFDFPDPEVALWIAGDEAEYRNLDAGVYENARYLNGIGRLKPGITPTQLDARLSALVPAGSADAWTLRAKTLLDSRLGGRRPLLLTLLSISVLVLLIACANAAHLVMVRGYGRLAQFGIQRALGASQTRIALEFLIEVLLVASMAMLAALALASIGLKHFVGLFDSGLPRAAEVVISMPVLGFALLATLMVTVICGVWPALRLHRSGISAALTRRVGMGPRGSGVERGLPIVALALSIAALSTAALLAISAQRLGEQDDLAEVDQILALQIFAAGQDGAEFFQQMERMREAAAAIPGVTEVGLLSGAPFTPVGGVSLDVSLPGAAPQESQSLKGRIISGPVLESLGIPLIRGRKLDNADRKGTALVAMLNERAARELFGAADAIGQSVLVPPFGSSGEPVSFRVVGVVADRKLDAVDGDQAAAEIWLPFEQYPVPFGSLLLSSPLPPKSLIRQAEAAVWSVDPGLGIYRSFAPADDRDGQLALPRFFARNAGAFAVFALALSIVGVYGVLAVDLSRRRRELALRAALGASSARALRFVASKGLAIGLPGILLGLLLAAFMAEGVRGLLFDVGAIAPWVVAASGLPLLLLTALVCWTLARRAARIAPNLALREE